MADPARTAVTDTVFRAGEILGRHPAGAVSQAYLHDGQLRTALYAKGGGLVQRHFDGWWGAANFDGRMRRLEQADLEALRSLLPISGQPPLLPSQTGLFSDIEMPAEAAMFRRWSMAELLAEPDDFAWLIKGLLAEPTYGQIAGEMKSLKTYLAAMIQVGLAAGATILDRFNPAQPRPVIAYVGEGGRRPYVRRLRRIAAAMGVDLAAIPLHLSSDVAPITSQIFVDSLRRDLAEVQPALVTIDPLYAYQGAKVTSALLNEMGDLLTGLSTRCLDAGASLLVINHMNQTGSGFDLKRISGAGGGEWVDSWLLLKHREAAQVEAGAFKLRLDIGSRQWGGTSWDLDLSIGRFDQDRGEHDGTITWDLTHTTSTDQTDTAKTDRTTDKQQRRIIDVLTDEPWTHTKTGLRSAVGGNRDAFERAFDDLIDRNLVTHTLLGRTESGTTKRRTLYGLTPNPDRPHSPGSPTEHQ